MYVLKSLLPSLLLSQGNPLSSSARTLQNMLEGQTVDVFVSGRSSKTISLTSLYLVSQTWGIKRRSSRSPMACTPAQASPPKIQPLCPRLSMTGGTQTQKTFSFGLQTEVLGNLALSVLGQMRLFNTASNSTNSLHSVYVHGFRLADLR